MKYTDIIVRFGELFIKGKNKKNFIKILFKNIKNTLKKYKKLTYEVLHDCIYINLNNNYRYYEKIILLLKNISGIHSLSPIIKINNKDNNKIDIIKKNVLFLIKNEKIKTFKIFCKRNDKKFYLTSYEITCQIATYILHKTKFKVDIHNPDIVLSIIIKNEYIYFFSKKILANGGLPLGANGKVLVMLSGGIDSPVATYLLIKRGILVECIHFESPPYTKKAVIDKIKDILKEMNKFQATIKLHIINFTKIQLEIYKKINESYAITIMRRMMYRIAEILAKKNNCLAIANGESIGQVASQTLISMKNISSVTNELIFRPLCIFDKSKIIDIAKKINTYDISIRPYEDCCTLFEPKKPTTRPNINKIVFFEKKIDYKKLITEAIENEKIIIIKK